VAKGTGSGRVGPAQVDGDLHLIDPETLHELEQSVILESPESVANRVTLAAGTPAGLRAMKNQEERIKTQKELSELIAVWAGKERDNGLTDRQIHKKFYITQGKTISEALAEPKKEMLITIGNLNNE
jgi:hypothetical protein